MWVDRTDASEELERRIKARKIAPDLAPLLRTFMSDGVVVIPGAVDARTIDALNAIITHAVKQGDPRLLYHAYAAGDQRLSEKIDPRGKRIVEAHGVLPEARTPFL